MRAESLGDKLDCAPDGKDAGLDSPLCSQRTGNLHLKTNGGPEHAALPSACNDDRYGEDWPRQLGLIPRCTQALILETLSFGKHFLAFGYGIFDGTYKVEGHFRQMV